MKHKWFNALIIYKENGIYKIHVNTIVAEYGRKWAIQNLENCYKRLSNKKRKYEFVQILKTKYSDKDMCWYMGKIVKGTLIEATHNERILSDQELKLLELVKEPTIEQGIKS